MLSFATSALDDVSAVMESDVAEKLTEAAGGVGGGFDGDTGEVAPESPPPHAVSKVPATAAPSSTHSRIRIP
jgi:hypothetical protein